MTKSYDHERSTKVGGKPHKPVRSSWDVEAFKRSARAKRAVGSQTVDEVKAEIERMLERMSPEMRKKYNYER